jgi:hypothetical protein
MKQCKTIYTLAIVMAVILLMPTSCSNKKTPSLDYAGAIEKVSISATQLTITSYTSNHQIKLEKGNHEFDMILEYLEQSKLTRSQPRFVEMNGKKTEVAIPYVLNYILVFTLDDGSEVSFDYGGEVWFNTEDMIYSASADAALFDLLNQLVSK